MQITPGTRSLLRAMERNQRMACQHASVERRAPYRVQKRQNGKPASGSASRPMQERLDLGETKRKPRAVQVRAPIPREMQIHAGYVQWVRLAEKQWPALRLGFHPANGEERDAQTAGKLRRMGVRAGAPDWMLPVTRGGYHGLAIEFKRPGGKLSGPQRQYATELQGEGWAVYVLSDCAQAVKLTVAYLRGQIAREFWMEK